MASALLLRFWARECCMKCFRATQFRVLHLISVSRLYTPARHPNCKRTVASFLGRVCVAHGDFVSRQLSSMHSFAAPLGRFVKVFGPENVA